MLKHHVVRVHARHLQTAELARNAFVHRLCQDLRPFGIGMHGIFQDVRIRIERFVEVYHLHLFGLGNTCYRLLDFAVPITRTRLETRVAVRQRSHPCNEKTHLRVGLAEIIHQRTVVADELVAVVGPIARIGIIDAQMDHHNVARKGYRITVFLLLVVRAVSPVQQGSTRLAEVAHLVPLAQHLLELDGIGVHFAVLHPRSVGNAIAHACLPDFLLRSQHTGKHQGQ